MKSNKILSIIISLFLLITSFGSVYYYYKPADNKYDINYLKYQIDYDHIIYLYSLIDKLDSEYEMLDIKFDDTYNLEDQTLIQNYFIDYIDDMNYIGQDENTSYLIKKDGQTMASKGDTDAFNEENSLVYTNINFMNNIYCYGDFCNEYKSFTMEDFINNYYIPTIYNNGKNSIILFGHYIPLDNFIINQPIGYEIYFKVNNDIIPSGQIYNYLDTIEPYVIYFIIMTSICLVCLFLLFLFIPTRVIENIIPYKLIKNWLFEINILFFGSIATLLGIGIVYLMKYSLEGVISYHLSITEDAIIAINYISWMFFYFICTLIFFIFKYMFKDGFITYLKKHTLFGICLSKIKSAINDVININLKTSLSYRLIGVLAINGFIVCIMMNLFSYNTFGSILFGTILYSLMLFIPSVIYIDKLYKQYQILLEKTKLLSQGQFDLKIDENLGMFNEYKNELLQVKDGFEKAVQEEIKANNLRTELITNVSHDLKTPITCIKNYVTLLKDEDLEEEKQKEYIQNIHSYTNRLARLVEDLFEVSKVSSGNISLDLIDLDIVDLVKQVLTENEDILSKNQLHVISKFNCNHMNVKLDSNKTYRIFENLIVNISKYALPYSRVYVEVNETDEHVIVEFKNISKDEMNFNANTITERFVRGDSSRNTNGSGLGLAIVKSYSELQNIDFRITIDGDLFKTTLKFNK